MESRHAEVAGEIWVVARKPKGLSGLAALAESANKKLAGAAAAGAAGETVPPILAVRTVEDLLEEFRRSEISETFESDEELARFYRLHVQKIAARLVVAMSLATEKLLASVQQLNPENPFAGPPLLEVVKEIGKLLTGIKPPAPPPTPASPAGDEALTDDALDAEIARLEDLSAASSSPKDEPGA